MKKSVKLFIIIGSLLIVAGGIVIAALLSKSKKEQDKTITIALYKNSKSVNQSIQDTIEKIGSDNRLNIVFQTLSSGLSLEYQIDAKKVDLVITPDGASLNHAIEMIKDKSDISFDITQNMYSTMKNTARFSNDNLTALPLMVNHMEIDIDKQSFMDSGMKAINTWDDIQTFTKIQQKYIDSPMIFAGSNAVQFLDLIGAICEAHSGYEVYKKAVDIINKADYQGENFDSIKMADELLKVDGPLAEAQKILKSFVNEKYISSAVKQYVNYDIDVMAQERRARVLFTTLEDHRSFNSKGISRFSSIYFPSHNSPDARHFTANVTFAVPYHNKTGIKTILEQLVTAETQSDLCRKTGLAPVLANCRTPDKQSDDVRYWIAATEPPLAGLGHDADLRLEQLEELKNEIISRLFV